METNLTFKQQLIFMMAERSVHKYGLHELTDGTIKEIKHIADKLSEGIPEQEPEAKKNEYPPFEKGMNDNTIRRLKDLGIDTPEELIEYDFNGECLYGFVSNIELLQYAMNHNIKLKNYSY